MPFTLPDTYNTLTRKGEQKSKATVAAYKTHLNRIADHTSLTTIEEFVKHPLKVTRAIKEICTKKDQESDVAWRARMRVYYSAIFMVLPSEMLTKPNPFYKANKKLQDGNPADFKV